MIYQCGWIPKYWEYIPTYREFASIQQTKFVSDLMKLAIDRTPQGENIGSFTEYLSPHTNPHTLAENIASL